MRCTRFLYQIQPQTLPRRCPRTRARAAALENALLLQRDALLSLGMMSFVPVRCDVMWLCNQPEGTIELERIGFFGVGETPASALDSSASAACGLSATSINAQRWILHDARYRLCAAWSMCYAAVVPPSVGTMSSER